MSGFKDKGFGDRLSAAGNARQAMVAKFLKRPGPDDPENSQRRAARAAVSAARDVRKAEREAARSIENARAAAERDAHAAAAAAAARERTIEEDRLTADKNAADVALQIERKAARDARYAARKTRK